VTERPSIATKQPLEARAGYSSKECLEYAAGFQFVEADGRILQANVQRSEVEHE
jgi:hypothetical protein